MYRTIRALPERTANRLLKATGPRWRKVKTERERELMITPPPATRGDCRRMRLPCVRLACRYNLHAKRTALSEYIDTRLLDALDGRPARLGASCALDVAEQGEHTLERVGLEVGVCRERIRQLESSALRSLRESGEVGWLLAELIDGLT